MTAAEERIENADVVIDVFGYWPRFHDAEILSMKLDRSAGGGLPGLTAEIYVFEMAGVVDDAGFFESRKKSVVVLEFAGIDAVQIEGFNNQNALFDLSLGDISGRQLEHLNWEVVLQSSYGVSGAFLCRSIRVVGIRPYESSDPGIGPVQSPPRPGEYKP